MHFSIHRAKNRVFGGFFRPHSNLADKKDSKGYETGKKRRLSFGGD